MTLEKNNWFRGLFCFLLLSIGAPAFLSANHFADSLPLILVTAAICMITCLFRSIIVRILFYLFFSIICLYHYFPGNTLSISWLFRFFSAFTAEISQLIQGELHYFPERASFLLVLLFVHLLVILTVDYDLWPIPFLVLMIYFMMLTVFRGYNLLGEMVWAVAVICTYLFIRQLFTLSAAPKSPQFLTITNLILALILGISASVPLFLPKVNQSLERTSEPIRNYLNEEGLYDTINDYQLSGSARTGFSENDEQLGGPLYDNNEIAFTAIQQGSSYWKIENKLVYTGSGWIEKPDAPIQPVQELPFQLNDYAGNILSEKETIQLKLHDQAYIPYPYGKLQVSKAPVSKEDSLFFLPDDQRFVSASNKENFSATLEVERLSYTNDALMSSRLSEEDQRTLQENLQLPDSLPARVSELAQELTKTADSLFEKTEAIQGYLKSQGNFRYSKTDAEHTPKDRDYVDYFLFDSKVGYCDNFSSSMVVLLRTLGIPARWAKGFTAGYRTSTEDSGAYRYEILNSHAHSWPEVFFPGFGWLPFEPTPAFINPALSAVEETRSEESAPVPSEKNEEQTSQSTVSSTESVEPSKIESSFSFSQMAKLLGIFLLLFFCLFLLSPLRKTVRWLLYSFYLTLFITKNTTAYQKLLKQFEKLIARNPAENLGSYSRRVEEQFGLSGQFISLTRQYEEELYGKKEVLLDKKPYLALAQTMRKIRMTSKQQKK